MPKNSLKVNSKSVTGNLCSSVSNYDRSQESPLCALRILTETGSVASLMASENSGSLPNEHDYAHAEATSSADAVEVAAPSAASTANRVLVAAGFAEHTHNSHVHGALPMELTGPAVGAEVDCPPVGTSFPQAEDEEEEEPKKSSDALLPPCGRRRNALPEDQNCACCGVLFERQGRSFNRRAVYTFTTPDAVQWAFPDATVHKKSFLCETCAQVVRSKCKRKQSGKRSLWLKPPVAKQVCLII